MGRRRMVAARTDLSHTTFTTRPHSASGSSMHALRKASRDMNSPAVYSAYSLRARRGA